MFLPLADRRLIRLALAFVQHPDVEAVVGHDAPRRARRVVGGRDRCRPRQLLPLALLRTESHARTEDLDEGKPRRAGLLPRRVGAGGGARGARAGRTAPRRAAGGGTTPTPGVPLGSPANARATKLAPAASAIT